jgi:hypothetical protein
VGNHRVRKVATNGLITTVAGNGSAVHGGDGGLATNAGIAYPSGLAIDASGNLYIADSTSQRVRKVTVGGTISTVAGNGTAGYAGDFGPATSAMLNTPLGLDIDASGTLYIADYGNSAIRKVVTNGNISTSLQGPMLPMNVKADGTGWIFLSDFYTCTLMKYKPGLQPVKAAGVDFGCVDGAPGGLATASVIGGPDGIAFDNSGNVVFADADYSRVRKVETASGVMRAFAGAGGGSIGDGANAVDAALSMGMAMAVDASGDVILSDALNHRRVRRITTTGRIYTLGGNGMMENSGTCATSPLPCPALSLTFLQAYGVAIGSGGAILVADRGMGRIVSINASGTAALFAGTTRTSGNGDGGPATSASLDPWGVARDTLGNTFVADHANHRIRRIDAGGTITTWAGNGTAGFSGDNGVATNAQINGPMAVATDAQGNLYFSEAGNRRVRKVSPSSLITTIAGNGGDGVTGDGGLANQAAVGNVRAIAVDDAGVVYIASNGVLRRILTDGRIESLPGWTHSASALAFRNGQLYIGTAEGLTYRMAVANGHIVSNDYNGDGKSDLPWRNVETGANVLWKSANSATTQTVTGVNNLAWKIVGQGDFDGDGKSDLVWHNGQNGANAIWRSADYTTQIPVTTVTNLAWTIEGVGDFDGDGKSDLLWRNATSGQNVVWRSGNSATQTVLSNVYGSAWQIVGVGDFDGDGKSDLLWRNTSTGMHSLWRSGNSATTLPVTGVTNLAWKIQGVGDFDGDGQSDIFWRNTGTGANVIWRSANSAQQITAVGVTSQLWRVVAVGDYDGDGKSDLFWRNSGNGSNALWRSGDAATQIPATGVTSQAWTIVPYENQP